MIGVERLFEWLSGTTWSVETGYAFEWLDADFGDPSASQRSRQNLSLQIHWGF